MNNSSGTHQIVIPSVTPMVKKLIIVTVLIWMILQMIVDRLLDFPIIMNLGLIPGKVIYDFFLWQPFTYIFLHSNQMSHIIFNMLLLWMLGGELEQRWGGKLFLSYYLFSGIGAGIIYTIIVSVYASLTGDHKGLIIPVIGASGSVFGLMLAYGILFGERVIYFMMIFPMKAKYFVMLLGLIELVTLVNMGVAGGEVANLAHLGGLISGFLFLFFWTRRKQRAWRQGHRVRHKSKKSDLRLVDDKETGNKDDPKYWN